jgi:hypothetical protein
VCGKILQEAEKPHICVVLLQLTVKHLEAKIKGDVNELHANVYWQNIRPPALAILNFSKKFFKKIKSCIFV